MQDQICTSPGMTWYIQDRHTIIHSSPIPYYIHIIIVVICAVILACIQLTQFVNVYMNTYK